ncbi:hypothetical protein N7537_006860 [Penicillium hordei]|jgi:hypothetical protein|uniref:Uncharacterized protein n=1 Tax=Penicillium hordei TaxID=40994 RepID=A0AAD6E9N2_9EURO|nr:uncharacterized protein N7537_006860 [Penicillium hordei]KAJ5603904.1 hypothetical protein N7537_006860 [Penicillium hordei]
MIDEPNDYHECKAFHGETGCGWSKLSIDVIVTSLPIVLKPKPATVRLVVVVRSVGAFEVDG